MNAGLWTPEYRELAEAVLNAYDEALGMEVPEVPSCDELIKALLNPPEPSQTLRAAADRYRRILGDPWSKKIDLIIPKSLPLTNPLHHFGNLAYTLAHPL